LRDLTTGGRVRYDAVRELRHLRRWAAELSFPTTPFEGHGYRHWKIPVPRALIEGPHARRPVQAACAQVLIDGAESLIGLRPLELQHVRVVAIVGFPNMFNSEICLFFDPDYFAGFCDRDTDSQRWTRKPDADLVATLGLTIPTGFNIQGYDTVDRDESISPPWAEANQTWLVGELG
jgi:hypothetical protein